MTGMEYPAPSRSNISPWRAVRQKAIREDRGSAPVPEFAKQAAEAPEDMLRYSILNNAAASASREQDSDEELSESSPNTDVANNKEGGAEK